MAILRILNQSNKYQDDCAIQDVLNYCTQEHKTSRSLIGGWAVNPKNAIQEMETFSRLANKDKGTRLRHFEISFSPHELQAPELAYSIAKDCAKFYGDDHQIVYAVHTDRDHIHAHFVMNTVRYSDGLKYRGTKQDLYDFLKHGTKAIHNAGLKESLHYVRDTRENMSEK